MRFIFQNDPDEIGRIPELLEEFSRENKIPPAVTARLNLILEELTTNVISYGFEGGETDRIEIDLTKKDDCIHFRFLDNGKPYNPLQAEPPNLDLPLEDRVPGGLGIHLVREIADQITYRFADGWNELYLQLSHLDQ